VGEVCRSCVFFDEGEERCTLFGVNVVSGEPPPCLSRRAEASRGRPASTGRGAGARSRLSYALVALLLAIAWLAHSYLALRWEYERASSELSRLRTLYGSLLSEYSSLSARYRELEARYRNLERSYRELEQSYWELRAKHSELEDRYSTLAQAYDRLLQVNRELEAKVREYLYTSNPRVGGSRAVELVQPHDPRIVQLVGEVTGGYDGSVTDLYLDLQRLYEWVLRNVKYRRDPPSTVVTDLIYIALLGERVLVNFTSATVEDCWQAATETLELRAGDCEDQAILLASMVRSYFLHYVGRDYACYVLIVEFADGGGHGLVVVPVADRNVVILDPAGLYLTSAHGVVTSRPVAEEFERYQRYWGKAIVRYWLAFDERRYVPIKGGLDDLVRAIWG